jgi:hypothetical protein
MKKKFRSDHQTVSNLPPLEEIAQHMIEKQPTQPIILDSQSEAVALEAEQKRQQEIYSTPCDGKKVLEDMLGFRLSGYKK